MSFTWLSQFQHLISDCNRCLKSYFVIVLFIQLIRTFLMFLFFIQQDYFFVELAKLFLHQFFHTAISRMLYWTSHSFQILSEYFIILQLCICISSVCIIDLSLIASVKDIHMYIYIFRKHFSLGLVRLFSSLIY